VRACGSLCKFRVSLFPSTVRVSVDGCCCYPPPPFIRSFLPCFSLTTFFFITIRYRVLSVSLRRRNNNHKRHRRRHLGQRHFNRPHFFFFITIMNAAAVAAGNCIHAHKCGSFLASTANPFWHSPTQASYQTT